MKVFVGVSGGVDSSVSAALLKSEGYEVVGVFIRTWQPDWIECTWRDERRDAMRVCAHLGIPFVELNLEQEYKKGVADYMIAEYRAGRTPNPDVVCNREVKFGGFLQWAIKQGADAIATGHYARTSPDLLRKSLSPYKGERSQLLKGKDAAKDQSYFLWTLTNDQLNKVLFPVGNLEKEQVRVLAKKFKLPTAAKKDSQGICFIGEVDMKEFLGHYIDTQPGDALNEKGEIIGSHTGALFYTLGERHGFIINQKTDHDLPYYVVAKDIHANTITVSQHPSVYETSRKVIVLQCVWRLSPIVHKKYEAQIRYHGEYKRCTISLLKKDEYQIIFEEPDFSLSPGQSVVVYDDEICIGGGIVK